MWERGCLRSRPASRLQRYRWSLMQTSRGCRQSVIYVWLHLPTSSGPSFAGALPKVLAVHMSVLADACIVSSCSSLGRAPAEVPSTAF